MNNQFISLRLLDYWIIKVFISLKYIHDKRYLKKVYTIFLLINNNHFIENH